MRISGTICLGEKIRPHVKREEAEFTILPPKAREYWRSLLANVGVMAVHYVAGFIGLALAGGLSTGFTGLKVLLWCCAWTRTSYSGERAA
jgi:hypothetical protein